MTPSSGFCDVETALDEIRAGRIIVVVDDEDRENEGDLTMAAEKVTPEAINFMAKHGRGLICLAMTGERLDHLRLGPMSAENTSMFGTAFTESIDATEKYGVTTGISAFDRAETVRVAIDPATRASDLARPGHIFPLRARKGGVLVRAGQTEASVDLARMAGMIPAGVICEVMNEDGTMARVPDLLKFCQKHNLKMLTTAELIRYRMHHEKYVHRVGEAMLPTRNGEFRMIAYQSEIDGDSHIALVKGDLEKTTNPVLVRMHAHCLVGDIFGANWCECHSNLRQAMQHIDEEGVGAVIYLHHRSQGFAVEKIDGNNVLTFHRDLRDPSHPETQRKTQRDVGIGAQILLDLGLTKIRILTNHPRKVAALEGFGIELVEQVPIPPAYGRATDTAVKKAGKE